MKSILFFISISIFITSNFAQNGTCSNPSIDVQNDANSTSPGTTFTQCILNPDEVSGKIIIYSKVTASPNGTLGLVQNIGTSCLDNSLFSSRFAELFIANDCSGTPIAPSSTIANSNYSSTFNPEWTGLSNSTNYTVKITITVPNSCSGSITEVCLNQYYPPVLSIICGTCATPSCPIFNAPDATTSSTTYPSIYDYDPSTTDLSGPLTFTNYYEITTTTIGTLGVKQSVSSNSNCFIRTYSLKANCAGAVLTPNRTNANQVGSGFNPEWDNLAAGTYILAITTNLPTSSCKFDLSKTGWYLIPPCTAKIGTFNVTGATLNNSVYDITAGSTITITNNSDAVMPTLTHELSYAFFSCKPTLPLTASQLLDLRTVPCYLGSDNGVSTNDKNNSGFSQTFSTLNKVYVLPYTRFPATIPSTKVIVNDGTDCYALGNILELKYLPPVCTAKIGTFNVTGATLNNSVYDISDGATITITNNSDAVMPTLTHELSYAFFSCKPTLPLTASQLLDLKTVPCYLGSDNGTSTNDKNNSGFSQTFSTLNKVYVLPYTRFPATIPSTKVIVNDGTDCYAIGNILELNYLPTCPTDQTFTKVDWSLAPNSPFIPFAPTTFNCNDGLQKIWKNVEPSINTNGRIQTSPGFNLNLTGLSVTKSSVLVSINGIPYSYYGPTGTAPAGVLDWGPMSPLGSGGTFDIIEPFIKGGSSVTLQICDARTSIQNIPYTVYDHATGAKTTGSVSVSNGTCQTVTFTVTSPTITWNIDGIASKIINNTDGSGTFDPSSLSAGQHIINYSYNNNGCTLLATQTITINPLVTPTSTNTTICSGTTSTLTASGTTTYNWYDASTGGNKVGSSSTLTTPILTASTSYWVSSGSGLCESTRFKVDVTVKPNVTPTFTLTNNFCINTQAQTLPTTSNNAIVGTWFPATINTSSAGTNTYTFTPNINQCASGVTETINVFDKPIANATPSTSSGKAVLDVDFTNLSTNATNLNWDFGNGETSTIIGNTSSSYINVGNYTVTLIASNGVCPDNIWTTIITVLPIDPLTFNIPNIFTPNNDGVNDNYFIELENAASFEATIFNRWGNEMISQNKINEKWDGKSASGKMSDDGVYFIKYKIVGLDKTVKEGVASFQLQN